MKIMKLDHVTIVVKDLEKTRHFYERLLGLEFLESVKLGDHTCHFIQLPCGQKLEFTEYHYHTQTASFQPNERGTIRHIAFEVDDVKAVEERIEAAGYTFHYPVGRTPELGVKNGLVRDPNGIELEFVEYVHG
jgi:catechol 2,3-dioxygenase-like lactoylglutathione lyase family enzyme